jgi:hypothetical protein
LEGGFHFHKIANLQHHSSKNVQIRYGAAPGGNKEYYIMLATFTLQFS